MERHFDQNVLRYLLIDNIAFVGCPDSGDLLMRSSMAGIVGDTKAS